MQKIHNMIDFINSKQQYQLKIIISEMHRTQSDFDDNLTFKVFIFQFINFYSSIIYIAFFKGKFVGYPGHYHNIFGNLRNEDVSSICIKTQNIELLEKMRILKKSYIFHLLVWQWWLPYRACSAASRHYDRCVQKKFS